MSDQQQQQQKPEHKEESGPEHKEESGPEAKDKAAPEVEPLKGDESDAEISKRLSAIIDSANERIKPLLELIKQVCLPKSLKYPNESTSSWGHS